MTDEGGKETVAWMACFTTDEGERPWGRTVGRTSRRFAYREELAVVAVVGAARRGFRFQWVRGEIESDGRRERGS
jgi:hypothetical protein